MDMDRLHTWLLKKCSKILAPYLAILFNLSLASVLFPTSMKLVTVVPLLNKFIL